MHPHEHVETQALLKHAGVNVDGLEALKEPHHEWDADGKDHYNETHPEPEHEVDWSKLDSPQWAWNNQAMKSQGWEPEGKENKDLMLGTTWDAKHPAPFVGGFADTFVKKDDYNKQIAPRNVQERDHFGNWGPEEAKNRRLLYGNTGSFEYRWVDCEETDSDSVRAGDCCRRVRAGNYEEGEGLLPKSTRGCADCIQWHACTFDAYMLGIRV